MHSAYLAVLLALAVVTTAVGVFLSFFDIRFWPSVLVVLAFAILVLATLRFYRTL